MSERLTDCLLRDAERAVADGCTVSPWMAGLLVAFARAAEDGFKKIEDRVGDATGSEMANEVFEIARAHRLAAGRVE